MYRATQLAAIDAKRDEFGERQPVADVGESFDVGARKVR
jgi:hypothetical protein